MNKKMSNPYFNLLDKLVKARANVKRDMDEIESILSQISAIAQKTHEMDKLLDFDPDKMVQKPKKKSST